MSLLTLIYVANRVPILQLIEIHEEIFVMLEMACRFTAICKAFCNSCCAMLINPVATNSALLGSEPIKTVIFEYFLRLYLASGKLARTLHSLV